MKRRKWLVIGISAVLLGCIAAGKLSARASMPVFLRSYQTMTVDQPSSHIFAGGGWSVIRISIYSIHDSPDKVLKAFEQAIGTGNLDYQGYGGASVSGVLPEGRCTLIPGKIVLAKEASSEMRGSGWSTLYVQEVIPLTPFDSFMKGIYAGWSEWRYGRAKPYREQDYTVLPDDTRVFQRELRKLRPDAFISTEPLGSHRKP